MLGEGDADDSLRRVESKIGDLFHDTDIEARIKGIFKSARPQAGALPIDPEAMDRGIRGLYAAFSHRRLSSPFRYCDCCITEAMASHWKTSPLKSLDEDDLWAVVSNVPPTVGTVDDVLYFTPRILEHAVREPCTLDLSWAFASLQQPDAAQPTAAEHSALRAFFEPIWMALRDCNPLYPLGISRIVLPTAVLTRDISHFLDLWIGSAALETAEGRGAFDDAFWDPKSDAFRQVTEWRRFHGML